MDKETGEMSGFTEQVELLKLRGEKVAKMNGHNIGGFTRLRNKPKTWVAECKKCRCFIWVSLPEKGYPRIDGELVADICDGSPAFPRKEYGG
jgi:hypothetical protein